jgi:thiamine diphosphokinase
MSTCFIFGAGDMPKAVPNTAGALVIAADGGYLALKELGIKPDIVVGDFDSMDEVQGENVIKLKREKDDTDMAAAVGLALERGARDIEIYGGLGGRRLSHTIANLQLVAALSQKGITARLCGDGCTATAVTDGALELKNACGYISVFCFGIKAKGVTLKGLKYPLMDAELTNTYPLGVSNQPVSDKAVIEVKSGTLIVIYGEKIQSML